MYVFVGTCVTQVVLAQACTFGTLKTPGWRVSNSQVRCEVPDAVYDSNTTSISVANNGQDAPVSNVSVFIYPRPHIISVSPSLCPVSGGVTVTIQGEYFSKFAGAIDCRFGDKYVVGSVDRNGTVTCVAPAAQNPGIVVVSVAFRRSRVVAEGGFFTYEKLPQIYSITPLSGSRGGGTVVRFLGGFYAVFVAFLMLSLNVASLPTHLNSFR